MIKNYSIVVIYIYIYIKKFIKNYNIYFLCNLDFFLNEKRIRIIKQTGVGNMENPHLYWLKFDHSI